MQLSQSEDTDCTHRTVCHPIHHCVARAGPHKQSKNNKKKTIIKKIKTTLLIKLYSMLQAGKAQHETTGKIFFLFPASAPHINRQGYLSTGHCCLFHIGDLVCHPGSVE